MSSDNGIYILKTQDYYANFYEYRVIQAQDFERIYQPTKNKNYNLPIYVVRFFEKAKPMTNEEAQDYIVSLKKDCSILEHGVKTIEVDKSWEQLSIEQHTCKDCGEKFVITNGEKAFYEKRDMKLPKRCKDCRKYRKNPELAKRQLKKLKSLYEKPQRYWDENI
jgi:hypothetical protein